MAACESLVRVNLTIDKELHRRLRMFAAHHDINLTETMRGLLESSVDAFEHWLAKEKEREKSGKQQS